MVLLLQHPFLLQLQVVLRQTKQQQQQAMAILRAIMLNKIQKSTTHTFDMHKGRAIVCTHPQTCVKTCTCSTLCDYRLASPLHPNVCSATNARSCISCHPMNFTAFGSPDCSFHQHQLAAICQQDLMPEVSTEDSTGTLRMGRTQKGRIPRMGHFLM